MYVVGWILDLLTYSVGSGDDAEMAGLEYVCTPGRGVGGRGWGTCFCGWDD